MKPLLYLIATLVCAALASAEIIRSQEKEFPADPGGKLRINSQGGSITVVPGGGRTIRVACRLRFNAGSESEADRMQDKVALAIDALAGEITASYEYKTSFLRMDLRDWPPVKADFIVALPVDYDVNLRLDSGDVELRGMAGAVLVEVARGDIRVVDWRGPVNAQTKNGDISAAAVTAKPFDCKLTAAKGDISLKVGRDTALTLIARAERGHVTAEGVPLTLDGAQEKNHLRGKLHGGGASFELSTTNGSIILKGEPSVVTQ